MNIELVHKNFEMNAFFLIKVKIDFNTREKKVFCEIVEATHRLVLLTIDFTVFYGHKMKETNKMIEFKLKVHR